jgi:hypothetical protein
MTIITVTHKYTNMIAQCEIRDLSDLEPHSAGQLFERCISTMMQKLGCKRRCDVIIKIKKYENTRKNN